MASLESTELWATAVAAGEAARGRSTDLAKAGASKAAEAEDAFNKKIACLKEAIGKKEQKIRNFGRGDRDNLDWHRRKEVKAQRMTLENAKKEAKEEAEQELASLEADLVKLLSLQKDAGRLHMIQAATDLLPEVHQNTAMIPTMVNKLGEMSEKLDTCVAAHQGQLKLEENIDIESAIRATRSQKCALTSRYQALQMASKDQSILNAGQVLSNLEEEKALHDALKGDLEHARGEQENVKTEIAKIKVNIGLAKLAKDEAAQDTHGKELKDLEQKQTDLKKQIEDLQKQIAAARPRSKAVRKKNSQELYLEAALEKAKELLHKTVEDRKEAKIARDAAKLELTKAEREKKKAETQDGSLDLAAERAQKDFDDKERKWLVLKGLEADRTKDVRECTNRLKQYRKPNLVEERPAAKGDARVDLPEETGVSTEYHEDVFDDSGKTVDSASASSAAAGSEGTLKRKAAEMDLTEAPPGATRSQWKGVQKAAQDPAQSTLATNTSAGSGVEGLVDPSIKFPGQRRVEGEDVH